MRLRFYDAFAQLESLKMKKLDNYRVSAIPTDAHNGAPAQSICQCACLYLVVLIEQWINHWRSV